MKKQIKKLTSIMFAISLILCIIGCKKETEFNILDYVYTVSFESNGGTEIDSQTVVLGETVKEPEAPEHTENSETEKFAGWYTDKELTKEYVFSTKVENSFTLYAKWDHKHVAGESWKNDDKNHWKECTGCKEKLESAEHEWTVTKDASGHWYECVCGEKKDFEEHTYDIWKVVQKPTASTEGTSKRECKICSFEETKQIIPIPERFVLVKAGSFQMGSNDGSSLNKPVHEVTITKPFYMGKYEVTQSEYEQYCSYEGSSPSSRYGDGDNYPAYYVSWYDALVYCNKRSMAEGLTPCYSIDGSTDPKVWGTVPTEENDPLCATWDAVECNWNANGYRLPTEAEWEYVARAGDNTVNSLTYSGTSDVNKLGEYAWYNDNSNSTTHEVGTKLPNAYGLFDMSGNVWEWCWNWVTYKYDTEAEGGSDTTGSSAGSYPYRVCRGGGWYYSSRHCAVSYRDFSSPNHREYYLGFRVMRASSN